MSQRLPEASAASPTAGTRGSTHRSAWLFGMTSCLWQIQAITEYGRLIQTARYGRLPEAGQTIEWTISRLKPVSLIRRLSRSTDLTPFLLLTATRSARSAG